jgi:hypothetical protein
MKTEKSAIVCIHCSGLAGTFAVAADDLDLVGLDGLLIVQLEGNVLDQERPHFVAEAVGVEVALYFPQRTVSAKVTQRPYLMRTAGGIP